MEFENAYRKFIEELGPCRKMVLSTSLNDKVTSRMMSIIILNAKLYFQTDITFRKYRQLKENTNIALCIDNIQIEGLCEEVGHPLENTEFCVAYQKHFANSYARYTALENERLFVVTPFFAERWLYLDGDPYIETFDIRNKEYKLTCY